MEVTRGKPRCHSHTSRGERNATRTDRLSLISVSIPSVLKKVNTNADCLLKPSIFKRFLYLKTYFTSIILILHSATEELQKELTREFIWPYISGKGHCMKYEFNCDILSFA